MTNLGKALVLFNLVLSLMFVAWGIGLISNQVPWNTPPSTDGVRVQGLVDELKREIDRLNPALQAADTRWAEGYTDVMRVETQRPTNQRYYVDLLKSVRQGGVADIEPPVQALEIQNNQLVLKRSGRPAIQFNERNALSISGYVKEIEATQQKIREAQDEVRRLNGETEKLTILINGTKPRPEAVTAAEKGLRVQLAEQQEMIKGLQLEQQYLYSPLTYVTLQTAQLRARQTDLTTRLEEINKATTIGRGW